MISMVVEDRGVWTAGAALAHIDLMLAIIARHAGPSLASDTARHLVVDQRPSQARYVIPAHLAVTDPIVQDLEAYVRPRVGHTVGLDEVAAALGLTSRTLNRRIKAALGLSPMRYVQKIRLDMALHLLGTTRLPNEMIAAKVGFADSAALYRLVRRHTGVAPGTLRTGQAL